jgi:hypothetical protein
MIARWPQHEPTLDEMLSDSIVKAIMAADGVDPTELRIALQRVKPNATIVQIAAATEPVGTPAPPNRGECWL